MGKSIKNFFNFMLITFIYRVMYTAQETVLPLRMQDQFNFDSAKVGLVLLGVALPNLVCALQFSTNWPSVMSHSAGSSCSRFGIPIRSLWKRMGHSFMLDLRSSMVDCCCLFTIPTGICDYSSSRQSVCSIL